MAYRSGGYALKEIGDYFGVHYSNVSLGIEETCERTPKALWCFPRAAYDAGTLRERTNPGISNQRGVLRNTGTLPDETRRRDAGVNPDTQWRTGTLYPEWSRCGIRRQ